MVSFHFHGQRRNLPETREVDTSDVAYSGKQVVMYDNTNIKVRQPSNADAQRSTYSQHVLWWKRW